MVRVDGYVNPTNRGVTRGPNNCCDNSNRNTCSGSRRCDNRFSFCLKSPGNTDDGTSTCMSPVLTSTQTNTNGAPIDFTQPTWLGLDNPLMLNGINTAWEVCSHDHSISLLYPNMWENIPLLSYNFLISAESRCYQGTLRKKVV